jgi:very-short-patch-repair endonuclease
VFVVCAGCGDRFRTTPAYAAAGRRYCNARCYRTSSAETSLERATRLALEAAGFAFDQEAQTGRWVVDFRLGDLVIEADGAYWHSLRPEVDARKTADLTARGYTVLRLAEDQIRDRQFPVWLATWLDVHELITGTQLPRLTPAQQPEP